ncbi:chordin-like [Pomacea canaliculata]|uniref:chordin-like n=1 Tax=Pomacea canaliculata TaxID=400727 RepID=UPI000D73484E|nr:chordin-like [Pomacea canaliculata]
MDVGCLLRYEAVVARVGTNNEVEDVSGSFGVVLGSLDNRLQKIVLLGPSVGHVVSSTFEYNISSGSVANLTEGMFHDLDKGRAFLQINSGESAQHLLAVCPGPGVDGGRGRTEAVRRRRSLPPLLLRGDVLRRGRQLAARHQRHVQHVQLHAKGKVVCHAVICPRLTCRNPIKLDSECCPTCPDESWSGTCTLGKDPRQYPLQRSWHPFLPLSGFAKCVTCTCKSHKNPICSRLECPKLNCPGRELVKSPEDCCPVCGRPVQSDRTTFDTPQLDINMERACNFMGEWKADGDSWHPRVKPFGYMKCFLCTCKAGEFTCGRTQCPELTCKRKIRSSQSCCDECDPNHQEEEDADSKEEKGCTFGGKSYAHRAKWRPPAAPTGDSRCAKCTCKDGKVRCKIRCPKNCDGDGGASPCCKHCEADKERSSRKTGTGDKKAAKSTRARGRKRNKRSSS